MVESMNTSLDKPVPQNDVMDIVYDRARESNAIIALAETEDVRIEAAMKIIDAKGLPHPLLITTDYFQRLTPEDQERLVTTMIEARAARNKPISAADARQALSTDTKYLAATMTKARMIDGYVAGNKSSTPDAIRPALQVIGKPENGYASSFFIMCFPDGRTLFFADCGFNHNPSAEELSKIAVATARNVQALGIEPRVAFLSFSTAGSAKHEHIDKVRTAIAGAKAAAPDLKISEHELQLDAALNEEIAARKVGDSEVAGKANILIFPDLNSGNIAYKMAAMLGVRPVGPLMQGLNAPVNDLSRGCKPQEIADVVAYAQMQAGALKKATQEQVS